jgi:hypothetical protein
MARSSLTPVTPLGSYGTYSAGAADFVPAAANVSDKNQFTASGNDLVFAHNTNGGAQTVTVTSVADPYGRTGDISTYSIGAGEFAILGPFKTTGWQQTDGKVYLEASSADVKLAVFALPG